MKIIIPLRLNSSRFPRKALTSFRGKPLLCHILDIADEIVAAKGGEIIVTFPSQDKKELLPFLHDRNIINTSNQCNNATERVIELSRDMGSDLYLTLPVDEPLLKASEVIKALDQPRGNVATLFGDFYCYEDMLSPLSAKLVTNHLDNIIYMSRSAIPLNKDGSKTLERMKKNVGVFFFEKNFLDWLWTKRRIKTFLDGHEGLEQLRWIELGAKIKAIKIDHSGFGLDVPEQLEELETR